MPNGRGRRRGGRGLYRRVHSEVAQLRREMNGHKVRRNTTNPPIINQRPYYPLRISMDLPQPGVEFFFSIQSIINTVGNQLGLSAQAIAVLTIKLRSIHGWAYMYGNTTDRVAIQGEISSLVPNVQDSAAQVTVNPAIHYPIIYRFQDFGTLNRPAHFGYMFPKMMQEIPLSAQSDFVVLACSQNSVNGTIHFDLQWSTGDLATPVNTAGAETTAYQ